MTPSEKGLQVIVRFPNEIPLDAQGRALLDMERALRAMTKLDVRVTKDLKTDDSKLRVMMTTQQRAKL